MINWLIIDDLISAFLKEDAPFGDITTDVLIDKKEVSRLFYCKGK